MGLTLGFRVTAFKITDDEDRSWP